MQSSSPESSRPPFATRPTLGVARPNLRELRASDRPSIERIVLASAAFSAAEVEVALELLDAPREEGYRFVVAELDGAVAGYACYGATPDSAGTWDLYWIVVDPERQGRGIGRTLLDAVETAIRSEHGRRILIETGGKPSYARQRAFYEAWGCVEVARVPDFYAAGDDKVVYSRGVSG